MLALVFPGFCLVLVPVLPGSRLFRDPEWPRVLPSQGPDLPVLAFWQAFRVPPPGFAEGAGLAAFCGPWAEAAA